MERELKVTVLSDVDTEVFERLEDSIRDLLEREGLQGVIDDSRTGNTTRTREEMIGKGMIGEGMIGKGMIGEGIVDKKENSFPDQSIKGILVLGEKVWFNDDVRCRLRICGFNNEQIKKLRNAKFIDLTITDYTDENTPGIVMHISEFGNNRFRDDIGDHTEDIE